MTRHSLFLARVTPHLSLPVREARSAGQRGGEREARGKRRASHALSLLPPRSPLSSPPPRLSGRGGHTTEPMTRCSPASAGTHIRIAKDASNTDILFIYVYTHIYIYIHFFCGYCFLFLSRNAAKFVRGVLIDDREGEGRCGFRRHHSHMNTHHRARLWLAKPTRGTTACVHPRLCLCAC